nr:LacI family DNA-binding transcriptional regulator [uncultured Dethiosulfovibrio sp.]
MSVTINHIAIAAKVSKSVVSKVINERPDVAPETRETVLKVIKDLGYVPSNKARNLSLGINKDIAVVLPSDNSVYRNLLFSLYRILSPKGYDLSFHITDHDGDRETEILRSIRANRLMGLIYFIDPDGKQDREKLIAGLNIPSVILGDGPGFSGMDRVLCPESEMAHAMAKVVSAHRGRTLCLSMPESKEYQRRRNDLVKLSLDEARCPLKDITFCPGSQVSDAEGYALMEKFYDPRHSLICSLSNVYTKGVFRFLRDRGQLERTAKVITLGDVSDFEHQILGCQSISMPVDVLAEEAAKALIDRTEKPKGQPKVIQIPPRIL